jgi:hypothetical protein
MRASRLILLLASILYILTFSVGSVVAAWAMLHWVVASIITLVAVCFWPIFVSHAFRSPDAEPTLTGQIDHPGGGIGVVIALVLSWTLFLRDRSGWGAVALFVLVPIFGIAFSLTSELVEYVIQSWIWRRRGADRTTNVQ